MKTFKNPFKRILLIIGLITLLLPGNKLFCQQLQYAAEPTKLPSFYLGVGLGVNDYGVGVTMEVPFSQQFSLNGNIGLGGWGLKLGGSLNYYPFDVTKGQEFSLGFSTASGLQNFETDLAVEPNGTTQKVNLDLYRVSTINLIYTYNIKAWRSCKIGFSGGWSICLTQDPYHVNNGVTLNSTSKEVMKIMQPGGLIVGIKFMIGA